MISLQRFGETIRVVTRSIESRFEVQTETTAEEVARDAQIEEWRDAVEQAAQHVAAAGVETIVDLHGIRTVVYPEGARESGTIYDGPYLIEDAWPRFAERLRDKAEQTKGAGPTWLRVDELGGLIGLTQAVHWPPQHQLAALAHNLRVVLQEFTHVRGVVVTHGAGPNWAGAEPEFTLAEDGTPSPAEDCVVLERRLPGQRRRRSHVIPLEGDHRIVLPQSAELGLASWYATEGTWLDWALMELGFPPFRRFVT